MFVRPENLEFPIVYHKFMAKDKSGKKLIEYRVQDLPEEYFEESLECIRKYYLNEEPMVVAARILDNPDAIEDYFNFWRAAMKQKTSLACFTNDGSEEFVAVNILHVRSKDEGYCDKSMFKSKEMRDITKMWDFARSKFNVFEHYNTDMNMAGLALCIHNDYRFRGIGTEVLRARVDIMKALGVNLTSTYYTAVGSQKGAEKSGYKESFVVSFKEMAEALPEIDFTRSNVEFFKTMDIKI